MDLIVWLDPANTPIGFELCYDKPEKEKSLCWNQSGFTHMIMDDGENRPGKYKSSPIHQGSETFEADQIYSLFLSECRTLPEEIRNFIWQTLKSHQKHQAKGD